MVNHRTQQIEFEEGKTVPYISQRISGLSKCCRVLAGRAAVTVRPLWVDAERKELPRGDPDIVPIWTRWANGEEKTQVERNVRVQSGYKSLLGGVAVPGDER